MTTEPRGMALVLTPFEPGPRGFPHWLPCSVRIELIQTTPKQRYLGCGFRKLTTEQVAMMRWMAGRGDRYMDIARHFDVDASYVGRIVKGLRRVAA